jgi:predicted RNA polymerase sigma factor
VTEDAAVQVRETVDALYRTESRRVLATLIRVLGDFDLAEEALHEAFAAAVEQWARDGRPRQSARVAGLGRAFQDRSTRCADVRGSMPR